MRQLSGVLSPKALIPFCRAPHDIITSPRPHLLMPSPWALGSQQRSLGRPPTFRRDVHLYDGVQVELETSSLPLSFRVALSPDGSTSGK